jgi:hypothetical protein
VSGPAADGTPAGGPPRLSWRAHLGVGLLFLALVALYTWPLITDLAHLWPDNHDPRLFTWVMLTIFRNLLTQPTALFHGNAFYPIGSSLTFAEPLLTPALVAGPLAALTGNAVLAYNLTLLLFWALSGWAMYAVAFRLTGDHVAALVAGMVFTLCPYRTELYLEFQMQIAFGIPLAIYTFVRFLETQRRRDLAAFCVVFWLQAIAVWYYALIVGVGLAVIGLQYAALRWTGWRPRALAAGAVGGGALLVALTPVAWPFFVTRRELGFERGLEDIRERSADVFTYLEIRSNWLYNATTRGHFFETSLFLGFVALALAAVALLWRRGHSRPPASRLERGLRVATWAGLALAGVALATRGQARLPLLGVPLTISAVGLLLLALLLARELLDGWQRWRAGVIGRALEARDWVLVLLGLALVAFLFSLGPDVRQAGAPAGAGLYGWLYPYLVPLRAIRAVTRAGVLVMLAGGLLAALGVSWLRARLPRRLRPAVLITAIGLLGLEYATFPLEYERVSPGPRPVDVALRQAAGEGVVLEWPTAVADTDAEAMFRSVGHGRTIVNGYSGFVPDFLPELSGRLTAPGPPFPTAEARAALARIYPLRYLVVLRGDDAISDSHPAWLSVRQAPPPWLVLRGTYGDTDLYELLPQPERARRVERVVAYDFLRRHRTLRVTMRPLLRVDALRQWVSVELNGRRVDRVAVDAETTVTLALTGRLRRAAPNVVALQYHYERRPATGRDTRYRIGTTGMTSTVDLRVRSGGKLHGDEASIEVNGVERAPGSRGYNLVALDAGGIVRTAAVFDTFGDPDADDALAAWIQALPGSTIVAGAVRDEGSGQLTEPAIAALRSLGVAGDLRAQFRASHAFVGVKGAPPGTAVEALGPRPAAVTVGAPVDGVGFELSAFALERGPAD